MHSAVKRGTLMKGQTVAEKIFSRVTGRNVDAGEFVWASPDLIYVHDVLGPLTIDSIRKMDVTRIGYRGKIVFVSDHIFPPKDSESAGNILTMKNYARENGITYTGEGLGIEHTLLIENGIIRPGMFVVGGDSHTVTAGGVGAFGTGLGSTDIAATMALGENWFMVPESMQVNFEGKRQKYVTGKDLILNLLGSIGVDGANYKSLEIAGTGLDGFNLDERLAIANMTVEGGAKAGIVIPNKDVLKHYSSIGMDVDPALPDTDATYAGKLRIDLDGLGPQVALPFSPVNVRPLEDVKGTTINQAYIGNCANGTLTDLRQAASILRNRTVQEGVKLIVVPATRKIYSQALEEGLIRTFLDAGAILSPSTCGACAGLHMGVLGDGEVAVSNTNRNYRGRMGHPGSKVYLANSYVAAAAALEGEFIDPVENI